MAPRGSSGHWAPSKLPGPDLQLPGCVTLGEAHALSEPVFPGAIKEGESQDVRMASGAVKAFSSA